MNADLLIKMVLDEGMKKPAIVTYTQGSSPKIMGGNRRGLRRVLNFPKTLERFAITGPQRWKPITMSKELEQYALRGQEAPFSNLPRGQVLIDPSDREPRDVDAKERVFGPRSSSQQREMRINLLLPNLAYRAGRATKLTRQGIEWINPNNTDAEREEAHAEFHRLLDMETEHIHKRVMRTTRKLEGVPKGPKKHPRVEGPVGSDGSSMMGRREYRGGPVVHDPFDHGYTGAPPSLLGEIEAGHFANMFRHGDSEEDSKHMLRKNLENFFMDNAPPVVRHDISHSDLMSWSRAMQPRTKRAQFAGQQMAGRQGV